MKKYYAFAAALLTAAALTGCGDYQPANKPRLTQTMKSNILTTVTTSETSRPETYSEYISSLKSMNEGILPQSSDDGIITETGILPQVTLPISTVTAVTGIELTAPEEITLVTSVPMETQQESVTAICETAEPIPLEDIPPVPSEAVSRSGE